MRGALRKARAILRGIAILGTAVDCVVIDTYLGDRRRRGACASSTASGAQADATSGGREQRHRFR
jgi:hypothetical protein